VVLRRTVKLAEIPAPTGGGEHTPGEWIDTSPLDAGLGCAAATIAGWEEVGCDQP
jgi:hypothetical protein